jgi:hypothetical protein
MHTSLKVSKIKEGRKKKERKCARDKENMCFKALEQRK